MKRYGGGGGGGGGYWSDCVSGKQGCRTRQMSRQAVKAGGRVCPKRIQGEREGEGEGEKDRLVTRY